MALTNFAALTDNEKKVWSMQMWRHARNSAFFGKYVGTSENAMIHRITELKKTEKGAKAVLTLIGELLGDGVAGDRQLEGHEEAMRSWDKVIQIDMLRHAVRHAGKMADQRSVVMFRNNARNALAYWLGQRLDQMAILTMSGVAYSFNMDGTVRVGSDLINLEFASDVTAPSTNRHFRWDDTTGLEAGATASVAATDTPEWDMLVDIKAKAQDLHIKPIRGKDGMEVYNVFMTPRGLAELKKDQRFFEAWKEARPRSTSNDLFTSAMSYDIDGMHITAHRLIYHASDWGGGAVEGQRIIIGGSQALGFADIGAAEWVEKKFDYDNQPGISVGKIFGFLKPRFYNDETASEEDFGLMVVDTAH